jgi:hypothetical protein
MKNKYKFVVYLISIFILAFSVLEYGNIKIVKASAPCCTFGVDCNGKVKDKTLKCCLPINEADCSQSKKNYCREVC